MPYRTGPAPGRRRVIRVLAVADEVDDALRAELAVLRTTDLILACGDLPGDYLGFLMDALDAPLVFVPGNHDPDLSGYRLSRAGLTVRAGLPARRPVPEGAINADGRIVEVAGLRIAGLGGCLRYGRGPHQYTERQQRRRAHALRRRARALRRRTRPGERAAVRGVDILITHAPPGGVGDGQDQAHRGFDCYHALVAELRPALLLHGHVRREGPPAAGSRLGETIVRNVVGRHLINVQADGDGATDIAAPEPAAQPGQGRRHAR